MNFKNITLFFTFNLLLISCGNDDKNNKATTSAKITQKEKELKKEAEQSLKDLKNSALKSSKYWTVTSDSWSTSDEKRFSEFVKNLGESKCKTIQSCLKSKANPYRHSDPKKSYFYADCADLPYVLRAYFAWKNSLPFFFSSKVTAILPNKRNIRYSVNGNRPRIKTVMTKGTKNPVSFIRGIVEGNISSSIFRVRPDIEDYEFYSPQITLKSIKPGTVIYDPNGHVAVVYKVSKGRIYFMDAHPGSHITYKTYDKTFMRSRYKVGAGFKNWRPFKVNDSGKVVTAKNDEIPDFSYEQFIGTHPHKDKPYQNWKKGQFYNDGQRLDYYSFVRSRLSGAGFRVNPVKEFSFILNSLCNDIQYRVESVNSAIARNIHNKPHPNRLPENIYGTDGEWETFSTPSRDARLKTTYLVFIEEFKKMYSEYKNGSTAYDYKGSPNDLLREFRSAYSKITASKRCQVSYLNSAGSLKTLSFNEVNKLIYKLSFDPYHCIELRWGDTNSSTCKDSATKIKWYKAEANMRNEINRNYDIQMNLTVHQLLNQRNNFGPEKGPESNILKALESL